MVTSTENAKSFIEINQILIAMQVYTFTSKATWYVLSKINQNFVSGGEGGHMNVETINSLPF